MSFRLFIDTACPKCHKPVKVCAIELHPTRGEIAIQYVQCADCGFISLKPLKLPKLAA
jgi:C4-type Zn-finger protein